MATTLFFNATLYHPDTNTFSPGELLVRDGFIAALSHQPGTLHAKQAVDCGGMILLPGFTDSHMHLPGSLLYQRCGVDLMDCSSLEEYRQRLRAVRPGRQVLRGFGWSQQLFQNAPGAAEAFFSFLNQAFPSLPVILFSDDYHSCICNQALLKAAAAFLPPAYLTTQTGVLTERSVFSLLHHMPALSFQPDEIEGALLACQALLCSRGITSVQTLMPIGMDEDVCWNMLQDLERRSLWHIHVHCAVTAHPADDPDRLLERCRAFQARQSPLVRLRTIKLYVDGVVDNGSAYLRAPYQGSADCGSPVWRTEQLTQFCTRMDREGFQIHAHTIGDAAAAQITCALQQAMQANGRPHNENRHVLAHLQLADPATVSAIGAHALLCALQPFWFAQTEIYAVDRARLGSRAQAEYPCRSLLEQGAVVSFGSDSPVTPDPAPLLGMSCAMNRQDHSERLTFAQALRAYTEGGAYQLFSEKESGRIAPGLRADFVLLRAPETFPDPSALSAAAVSRTYIGGQCIWTEQ